MLLHWLASIHDNQKAIADTTFTSENTKYRIGLCLNVSPANETIGNSATVSNLPAKLDGTVSIRWSIKWVYASVVKMVAVPMRVRFKCNVTDMRNMITTI